MKAKILALAVVVALVAGAAYAVVRFRAPADDGAVALVPSDAIVYVNVFLSPSTSQKRALEMLLEKFEATPNVEMAKGKLVEFIDDALVESGLQYESDIEPWLGDQAALFLSKIDRVVPEAAALVATEDEDATRAMVDKFEETGGKHPEDKIYEGVEYAYYPDEQIARGFVGSFWVIGSESGFKAVVDTAAGGEPLVEEERYESVTNLLADDLLAAYYVDLGRIFETLERAAGAMGMTRQEQEALDALDLDRLGPAAAALSLNPDRVVLETANVIPEGNALRRLIEFEDAPVLRLPAASWAAFGTPDLGDFVEQILSFGARLDPGGEFERAERAFSAETGLDLRADVLSWIGDAGAFVQGTGLLDLGGGVVIETDDAGAARRALVRLARFGILEGATIRPAEIAGAEGYALQERGMPEPVYAVVSDERAVVAYGRAAVEDALSRRRDLADSDLFRPAYQTLGEEFLPVLYLDVDTILELAQNMGAQGDRTYREDVKPWLEPLTYIVGGTRLEDDVVLQRTVIGVQ